MNDLSFACKQFNNDKIICIAALVVVQFEFTNFFVSCVFYLMILPYSTYDCRLFVYCCALFHVQILKL